MAMGNLQIAQHRDTLRYAHTRGGSYLPKPRKFSVRDYVYLQRQVGNTLDTVASKTILRILQVLPTGVLELQGSDGCTIKEHQRSCTPCHLPNLDPSMTTAGWQPPANHPCFVCHRTDDASDMLLCDGCNQGYHLFCLQSPLTPVPDGDWFCPRCRPSHAAPAK